MTWRAGVASVIGLVAASAWAGPLGFVPPEPRDEPCSEVPSVSFGQRVMTAARAGVSVKRAVPTFSADLELGLRPFVFAHSCESHFAWSSHRWAEQAIIVQLDASLSTTPTTPDFGLALRAGWMLASRASGGLSRFEAMFAPRLLAEAGPIWRPSGWGLGGAIAARWFLDLQVAVEVMLSGELVVAVRLGISDVHRFFTD